LLELLPNGAFARVNRSDLVAVDRVHLVADDHLYLKPSLPGERPQRLPLGLVYKEAFLALMGAH
jgi:hypothetical protein